LQSLLVFITGAFLILAYCADKHGSQNFQEVIREVLGPGAYIVTQIIITLYMFGSTVAYMILIGDQLQSGMYVNFIILLIYCKVYKICSLYLTLSCFVQDYNPFQ